jgi:hypothetical protein
MIKTTATGEATLTSNEIHARQNHRSDCGRAWTVRHLDAECHWLSSDLAFGDVINMRLILITAALGLLCGCRTGSTPQVPWPAPAEGEIGRVFAAYAPIFPEATRVAPPANALKYFSGVYSDGLPKLRLLSGNVIYLFPDATFVWTEWADIMPETKLTAGDWRYQNG